MPQIQFKTREELQSWATAFAAQLRRPCVILLDGNLGAGKTQMVRWLTAALGVTDAASPTFAIHHEYTTPTGNIDHVDLYRVKSDEDLEASGFWDLFRNPQGLLFVEWAERLPEDVWPADWSRVHLRLRKDEDDEGRILNWEIKRS